MVRHVTKTVYRPTSGNKKNFHSVPPSFANQTTDERLKSCLFGIYRNSKGVVYATFYAHIFQHYLEVSLIEAHDVINTSSIRGHDVIKYAQTITGNGVIIVPYYNF
jgi:hypothetical protein